MPHLKCLVEDRCNLSVLSYCKTIPTGFMHLQFYVKRENDNRKKLLCDECITGDVAYSALSAARSEQSPFDKDG